MTNKYKKGDKVILRDKYYSPLSPKCREFTINTCGKYIVSLINDKKQINWGVPIHWVNLKEHKHKPKGWELEANAQWGSAKEKICQK